MQIDGMREFAARTRELSFGVAARDATSAGPLAGRKRSATDAFDISDLGRRLCLERAMTSSAVEMQKSEAVKELSPVAQRVDRSMAKAQGLLEQMRTIALTAQDESLSVLDRIELQIELEDLRDMFEGVALAMRKDEPIDETRRLSDRTRYIYEMMRTIPYLGGDDSSVLSRARERIMKGEAWDVREVWVPIDRHTGSWAVVGDETVWTLDEEENVVDSGRSIPTVRERLENNSVCIMDAESATKAVEIIDQKIEAIAKWREDLPVNLDMYGSDERLLDAAYDHLKGLSFGEKILTTPTTVSLYLDGDMVFDVSSFLANFTKKIDKSVPGPLDGLSISGEQTKPGVAWGREGAPIWRIDPDVGPSKERLPGIAHEIVEDARSAPGRASG